MLDLIYTILSLFFSIVVFVDDLRVSGNWSWYIWFLKLFLLLFRQLQIDSSNHILNPILRIQSHNWRGNNYGQIYPKLENTIFTQYPSSSNLSHGDASFLGNGFDGIDYSLLRLSHLI
jgi:hypothetical protein